MTWRETKRVDDVVIMEGPANDSLVINFGNDESEHGGATTPLYSSWTWTGEVRDADGLLMGTIDCIDIREVAEQGDDTILKQQGRVDTWDVDLEADVVYYGGIRGVSPAGFADTFLEFELHAGRILVQ